MAHNRKKSAGVNAQTGYSKPNLANLSAQTVLELLSQSKFQKSQSALINTLLRQEKTSSNIGLQSQLQQLHQQSANGSNAANGGNQEIINSYEKRLQKME